MYLQVRFLSIPSRARERYYELTN